MSDSGKANEGSPTRYGLNSRRDSSIGIGDSVYTAGEARLRSPGNPGQTPDAYRPNPQVTLPSVTLQMPVHAPNQHRPMTLQAPERHPSVSPTRISRCPLPSCSARKSLLKALNDEISNLKDCIDRLNPGLGLRRNTGPDATVTMRGDDVRDLFVFFSKWQSCLRTSNQSSEAAEDFSLEDNQHSSLAGTQSPMLQGGTESSFDRKSSPLPAVRVQGPFHEWRAEKIALQKAELELKKLQEELDDAQNQQRRRRTLEVAPSPYLIEEIAGLVTSIAAQQVRTDELQQSVNHLVEILDGLQDEHFSEMSVSQELPVVDTERITSWNDHTLSAAGHNES